MKKLFYVPILTLLFLFMANMASAEWVATQLTTDIYYYDTSSLQINANGHMVWNAETDCNSEWQEDSSYIYHNEIFYYDGAVITQLTDNIYYDSSPQINDSGHVAWLRKRPDSNYSDIFYYDGTAITQLTNNTNSKSVPQINDNGHLVWSSSIYPESEIFYYDGTEVTQLTENSNYNYDLQISANGHVVWQGRETSDNGTSYKIFYYDGTTITPLAENTIHSYYNLQISAEGQAVWSNKGGLDNGTDWEIFYYDGTKVTQLTNNPVEDNSAQINKNGYVVWSGSDGSDSEIFYYDGTTITQLSDNTYTDSSPQINDNGHVVWRGYVGTGYDIFYYDGTEISQLTDNPSSYSDLQINEANHVIWFGENRDVYFYNGTTVEPVTLNGGSSLQLNDKDQIAWSSSTPIIAEFLDRADNDLDGLEAFEDNCPDVHNYLQQDEDEDGIGNVCDSCPDDPKNDADKDGICGDIDICPNDPNNDIDGDGLCGNEDNCPAVANFGQIDEDGDGIGDECDNCLDDPDNDIDKDGVCSDIDICPNDPNNDIDNDGVCGDEDNCPAVANSGQEDEDRDTIGDDCDTWPNDIRNDWDNDTISGEVDNCPLTTNPGQEDADGDNLGDVCDDCPDDPDNDIDNDNICGDEDICPHYPGNSLTGDGLCGDEDNCPGEANPGQEDEDGDGIGDACDNCLDDPVNDPDEDGVCGNVDNCPEHDNAYQGDCDNDGTGDPCDPDTVDNDNDGIDDTCDIFPNGPNTDSDRDGIWDSVDNCPSRDNPNQEDCDGDGYGDVCDTVHRNMCGEYNFNVKIQNDDDKDGINDDCDNCPGIKNPNQGDCDNDGYGDACDPDFVDEDGDEISAEVDNCPAVSNYYQHDCDNDGVGDACDPDTEDTDSDGIDNACDNCPGIKNPNQGDCDNDGTGDDCDPDGVDTDQDGICDNTDECPDDPENDYDYDGLCGDVDNCPDEYNPLQEMAVDPGGDCCYTSGPAACSTYECGSGESCPPDSDGDGLVDFQGFTQPSCTYCYLDNDPCPDDPDNDIDKDHLCAENYEDPDNKDLFPYDRLNDIDEDGIGDHSVYNSEYDPDIPTDNCPRRPNPGQEDEDNNGIGDVCEFDIDYDGILIDWDENGISGDNPCKDGNNVYCDDNCPDIPNPRQLDANGDGTGDACDTCGDGGIAAGEECDDGNIVSNDGCSSDCQLEKPANIDVKVEIFDNADLTYNYEIIDDSTNNSIFTVEDNLGQLNLSSFSYTYDDDVSDGIVGLEINGLNLNETTKEIILPYTSSYCVVDAETFIGGSFNWESCSADENRITWSFGINQCKYGFTVTGQDKDSIDQEQYTCEVFTEDGTPYVRLSGFSHTSIVGLMSPCDEIGDADLDTVCDDVDNCLDVENPEQEDGDEDGVGDACDNCPDVANPDQNDADEDRDGVADTCDLCPDGVGPECDIVLPYIEDFSEGIPNAGWIYYSSEMSYGRIQVEDQRLRMDVTEDGHYNLNEAVLIVDLENKTHMSLSFFQAEFEDELEALPGQFTGHVNGDGVAVSADGGVTWYSIVSASELAVGSSGQTYLIDLDAKVAEIQSNYDPAFNYSDNFMIKFQQYDNTYSIDGRAWDDIAVFKDPDIDDDGIINEEDNCFLISNPDQKNIDVVTETGEDILGDVCDADTIYGTISGDIQAGVVTVYLYKTSCGGDVQIATTTTDVAVNGYYAFGDLVSQGYLLRVEKTGYRFEPARSWPAIPQTVIQSYDFTTTADPAP